MTKTESYFILFSFIHVMPIDIIRHIEVFL